MIEINEIDIYNIKYVNYKVRIEGEIFTENNDILDEILKTYTKDINKELENIGENGGLFISLQGKKFYLELTLNDKEAIHETLKILINNIEEDKEKIMKKLEDNLYISITNNIEGSIQEIVSKYNIAL
jgi:HPt (histidine-containing phosphotransfer) domain-containing protein